MDDSSQIALEIQSTDNDHITFVLTGRLDFDSVPTVWERCINTVDQYQPQHLTIDAQSINYCDNAGIALFEALKFRQQSDKHEFKLSCLAGNFKKLMHFIEHPEQATFTKKVSKEECSRFSFKYFMQDIFNNIRENITFLGMLAFQIFQLRRNRYGVRWKDFGTSLEDTGPRALPIICLCGLLIGFISTFQSAAPMGRFGTQIYIINLVALGLVREMGPLITAILLAGRTASSFAAEIGSMKINQELDALTTMGLSPLKFLTIPRIFATALMTPLLNIFLIVSGLLGCAIVMQILGYNIHIFMHQLESAVRLSDFIGGSIKGFAFGVVIAAIGCLEGLKTKLGPSAVGYSTTKAVVSSLIMIIIVDGMFAYIYYLLGV